MALPSVQQLLDDLRNESPAHQELALAFRDSFKTQMLLAGGDGFLDFLRELDPSRVDFNDPTLKFSGFIDRPDILKARYEHLVGSLKMIKELTPEQAERVKHGVDISSGFFSNSQNQSRFATYRKYNDVGSLKLVESETHALKMESSNLQDIFRPLNPFKDNNAVRKIPIIGWFAKNFNHMLVATNHGYLKIDRWLAHRFGFSPLVTPRGIINFVKGRVLSGSDDYKAREAGAESAQASRQQRLEMMVLDDKIRSECFDNMRRKETTLYVRLMGHLGLYCHSYQNLRVDAVRKTDAEFQALWNEVSSHLKVGYSTQQARVWADSSENGLVNDLLNQSSLNRDAFKSYVETDKFFDPVTNNAVIDLYKLFGDMWGDASAEKTKELVSFCQAVKERHGALSSNIMLYAVGLKLNTMAVANNINPLIRESADYRLHTMNAVLRGGDMRAHYSNIACVEKLIGSEGREDTQNMRADNITLPPMVRSIFRAIQSVLPFMKLGKNVADNRGNEVASKATLYGQLLQYQQLFAKARDSNVDSPAPVVNLAKLLQNMVEHVKGTAVSGWVNTPEFSELQLFIETVRGKKFNINGVDGVYCPEDILDFLYTEVLNVEREAHRVFIALRKKQGDAPTLNAVRAITDPQNGPRNSPKITEEFTFADFNITAQGAISGTPKEIKPYWVEPDIVALAEFAEKCRNGTISRVTVSQLNDALHNEGCFLKRVDLAAHSFGANAKKPEDLNCVSNRYVSSDLIQEIYGYLKEVCPSLSENDIIPFMSKQNNPSEGIVSRMDDVSAKYGRAHHADHDKKADAGAYDPIALGACHIAHFNNRGPKVFWENDAATKQPAIQYVSSDYYYETADKISRVALKYFEDKLTNPTAPIPTSFMAAEMINAANSELTVDATRFANPKEKQVLLEEIKKKAIDSVLKQHEIFDTHSKATAEGSLVDLGARINFAKTLMERNDLAKMKRDMSQNLEQTGRLIRHLREGLILNRRLAGYADRKKIKDPSKITFKDLFKPLEIVKLGWIGNVVEALFKFWGIEKPVKDIPRPSEPASFEGLSLEQTGNLSITDIIPALGGAAANIQAIQDKELKSQQRIEGRRILDEQWEKSPAGGRLEKIMATSSNPGLDLTGTSDRSGAWASANPAAATWQGFLGGGAFIDSAVAANSIKRFVRDTAASI
jgi:hypothetical protein